ARTRQVSLEALAHQEVPFEKLVEQLRPLRDLSRPPLIQVMLAHQPAPGYAAEDFEIPGVGLEVWPVPTGTSKFDLTLSLTEQPGAEADRYLGGHLEYDSDLFDEATVVRFERHFEELLAGAMADPGRCLSKLSQLGEAERQQAIRDWDEVPTAVRGAMKSVEARDRVLRGPTAELLAGIW